MRQRASARADDVVGKSTMVVIDNTRSSVVNIVPC